MSITKHRCRECEKIFDAEKSNARFCSSSCRQRDYRRRHAVKFKKQAETIKGQAETIKLHTRVMTAVIPDPKTIEKISCEVGKDLTECKRPDGSHLYTDMDLWILVSRLASVGFTGRIQNYASAFGPLLLSVLNTNQLSMDLISDFAQRFKCKFDDVRRSSSYIHTKEDGSEDETIIEQYASLAYSR